MVGQNASEERTEYTRTTKRGSQNSSVCSATRRGYSKSKNYVDTRADACTTNPWKASTKAPIATLGWEQTLDSSSGYEHRTIPCQTAYQTAGFKDPKGEKERQLGREQAVELAPCRLEASQCQEKCRAIPADIIKTVEVVGNSRYRRSDNGEVQSNQEHGEDQGKDYASELDTIRM